MTSTNHDWYNLNSIRAYPFDYSRNPISDKEFQLHDYIIVDCMAVINSNSAKVYLSSIHFSGAMVTATFYDSVSDQDIFMAQSPLSTQYNTSEIISLSNDISCSGRVAFGDLTKIYEMRLSGLHKFGDIDTPLLEYCYVCCGAPVVSSIRYNDEKIYGNVNISSTGLLNTLENENSIEKRQITVNGINQNVLAQESSVLFYMSDPKSIKDICPPPKTVCECPETPIKKINNVTPNPVNGNIQVELGSYTLDKNSNKFVLEVGQAIGEIELTTTEDGLILSLSKNSEEICEETKNMPFEDGRLPSEASLSE